MISLVLSYFQFWSHILGRLYLFVIFFNVVTNNTGFIPEGFQSVQPSRTSSLQQCINLIMSRMKSKKLEMPARIFMSKDTARRILHTCSSRLVMNNTITAEAINSGFDRAMAMLYTVAVKMEVHHTKYCQIIKLLLF